MEPTKQFNYFENHSDEYSYTVGYGDPDDDDFILTSVHDSEQDAKESCKRLNKILSIHKN